jgi:mRNA-degrading endonuclease YafQ of YafQ-DinJ toxin-antitoxin module
MWKVFETKRAKKAIDQLPPLLSEKYALFKQIVIASSPSGLKQYPGFKDHSLSGEWDGHRASRLDYKFRVIYRPDFETIQVDVIDVTAHDYRRKK